MVKVPDPRGIVARKELLAQLESCQEAGGSRQAIRGQVLAVLKGALAAGEAEVQRRFEAGDSAAATVAARSHLADQLVRVIHDFATGRVFRKSNPTAGDHLGVAATGGYGRGELAPFSDIDILFLIPYKETPWIEQIVEYMLYMLWDLGLKVGHATRTVAECVRRAKGDLTIRTALLETRYLWGDRPLYDEMRERMAADVVAGSEAEFVQGKLDERNRRHERMGDSRYLLEPNVKEGKGGLRDLQTLFWIGKYLYRVDSVSELVECEVLSKSEMATFAKAQEFLWQVRCHLHYLSGRPEERLTFDVQPEMARRLGYTDHAGSRGVERFIKHYFLIAKDVGDLTRIFCAALEEQHRRRRFRFPTLGMRRREIEGFLNDGSRLDVAGAGAFADDPIKIISLFQVADASGLDIHPRALRLITQNLKLINGKLRRNPDANRVFLDSLTSKKDPETALKRMNEAGVLGRFVPDFGRIVAQMQHDMYHVYTVDEHTIQAIGILSRIEKGALADELPLANEIIHKVLSRRALYVATFLHDIAKGRGGDHSELGADVARRLCPRLGLDADETETVAWLVRHHLAFSNTAFRRDIHDPKTVSDFGALIQSPERLRLLLVLTAADIRAVGPKVWNGWKGTLLRQLYYRTEALLSGGGDEMGHRDRIEQAHAALRRALADWPEEALRDHLARHYPTYWLAGDGETLERHARLMRRADREATPLVMDTRVDTFRDVTEITVFTPDHAGLFSVLAGAMALSGANIVDARIFTTIDGMALDTFWVQDGAGHAYDRPDRLARMATVLEQALSGRLRPEADLAERQSLPRRAKVFKVAPRVLIDNNASNKFTVIEVNGRDRPGVLHDVTRALTHLQLSIASARVSTYGERVVDVFYVKDVFGLKVTHERKLAHIRERLLEALTEPKEKAAAAAAE